MDRTLFAARTSDNDHDAETEVYIKNFILRFISKYVIPEERDDRVSNAMRFFNVYLKGAFVPFTKDVVIISGPGKFKIWEYEDSMAGELELLSRLTVEEQPGCFALPGKGFWSTNLDFSYSGDRRHESLRIGGIFLSASGNASYEVDNAFV
jgi:hypothetical protein